MWILTGYWLDTGWILAGYWIFFVTLECAASTARRVLVLWCAASIHTDFELSGNEEGRLISCVDTDWILA